MRTDRKIRANGIVYTNVSSYTEDRHNYIFVINGEKISFPKKIYDLNISAGYFDLLRK